MASYRNQRSRYDRRISLAVLLTLIGAAAGIVYSGSTGADSPLRPALKDGGNARLVSFEPLPEANGAMCEFVPASASGPLRASLSLQQRGMAAMAAEGSAEPRPSDTVRVEASKRPPVRMIKDPSAAFSAVAIDLVHNEVVLTDENNFGILTYDRLENTPPGARMSEPKRMIKGNQTYLEFNCSLYVDPVNGDIYSVNNDTLNWLTVFSREVKGDMPPTRKLRTPHTTYGIVIDEEKKEILVTSQDDHAVLAFDKMAKEHESPVRVLQGSRTQMADPHGITLDPKTGLIFVTNWGTTNERPPLGSDSVEPPAFGGVKRTLWPVELEHTYPSSGKFLPPSITVYPKGASGDTAPLRVIQGAKTGLNWPTAIAVDPEHRELFVANDTADSVTVYSTEASGDVAPLRVLKGPKSLIKNPTGVAYDAKNDELWVANFGSHSATVYNRTASGDATPLRVIRSALPDAPAPMLGNPRALTYDSNREQILDAN